MLVFNPVSLHENHEELHKILVLHPRPELIVVEPGVVAYTCNPSTWEAKAG
jgi:hypothetical protein